MDINRATLDSLFTGFNRKLQDGYKLASDRWQTFAMEVPSSTSMETYGWLLMLSRMREWFGPRQLQNIESKVMQVLNRDFEHTIGVRRNDIEDDTLGIYGPLFTKMGEDAASLWGRLAFDALIGNGNWLDDAAFFGTSRKYGGNTISNTVTTALTATTFNTAYQTMSEYLMHNDEPLEVIPDLLVVGPKNRTNAHNILKNQFQVEASGTIGVAATDNPNRDVVDIMVHPRFVGTYDDYWVLMQTKGVVKPIAVQKRKVGQLVRRDREEDDCVFQHNRNEYGLHYRGAAALTLPHLAYLGGTSA